MTKSNPEVTVLVVYDETFLKKVNIMDRTTIVVEGEIKEYHIGEIHSRLLNAHLLRHTVKNYNPGEMARAILKERGYRIIDKAVVYNMDYTGGSPSE